MRWCNLFNPNTKTEENSPVWYWLSLALLSIAVIIAFNPIGPDAVVVGGVRKNLLALKPQMTGILLSIVFVSALLFRRCVKLPENVWILLLIVGDILLFASFLEMIFTGKPVEIFKIPVIKGLWGIPISISPRRLALLIIGLTLIGARAIAGIGVFLLAVVTLIHISSVEASLGSRGIFFLVAGYVSLLIQLKIPGMHIDKSLSMVFLEDIGRGTMIEARKNIQATEQMAVAGVKLVAKGAAAYATGGVSMAAATVGTELANSNVDKKALPEK